VKPGDLSGIGWGFGAIVGLIAAIAAVVSLATPALNPRPQQS